MRRQDRDQPFLSEYPHLQLLRQDGSCIPASEAFKGKKYVLLYFSAHWCPPCQRFTPLLADFYAEHAERLKFEVLFISSDRQEGRMMDFFQNRSSNYVVRRQAGKGDATSLPSSTSTPPPTTDTAAGASSMAGGGTIVAPEKMQMSAEPGAPSVHEGAIGKGLGLDVTAPFLPPPPSSYSPSSPPSSFTNTGTSGFTVEPFTPGGQPRHGVNRTPSASGMGQWLALPFKEVKVSQYLARRFRVTAIPKLVVVAADTSCVITKEGKAMVLKDEHGEGFPWRFAEDAMGDSTKRVPAWLALVIFVILVFLMCSVYFPGISLY